MSNVYQRKTINVFISNRYQEMLHLWNVPLNEENLLPDQLIVSYTYHQALNLEMPDDLKVDALIYIIHERAGIHRYIKSRYAQEEEYFTLIVYNKYFRRLIRNYFNLINILDETVNIIMKYKLQLRDEILEIEEKMKVADPRAFQAFMTLINNYIMEKY